jgi:hypothetical protein
VAEHIRRSAADFHRTSSSLASDSVRDSAGAHWARPVIRRGFAANSVRTNYSTLLTLNIIHALLGTFVPATIMMIFRNLPARWWLVAIGVYCVRVGYTQNFGVWTVGYYMDHFGWQWLYWQDIVLALLMTWLVYIACPDQPIDRALLANADWGGMLLFGTGLALIFAGLDQGNRLVDDCDHNGYEARGGSQWSCTIQSESVRKNVTKSGEQGAGKPGQDSRGDEDRARQSK